MLKTNTSKQEILVLCFSLLTLLPYLGNAQTVLKGTITDSATHEKLPGVVVAVDSIYTTITDREGRYQLKIPSGKHSLIISYFSYNTSTIQLSAKQDTVVVNVGIHSQEQEINPVVVSASMYEKNIAQENVSMEVLKAQTITNTGAVAIDEAMNNVPGVNITYDGQANIRGGSGWTYGAGSRVLMLVDGLPELAADASDVIWNFLPIEQTQQVEVIKGASSVLYGSSALDGVINLRTTEPGATPQTTFNIYEGIYGNPTIDSVPWKAGQAPGFQGFTFMHSQQFGQLDLITSGEVYNETSYLQGQYFQRIRGAVNARYRFKHIEGLIIGLRVNEMYNNESNFLVWNNDKAGILEPDGGESSLVPGKFIRESIDPYVNYYLPDGSKISLQGRYFLSDNEDYGSTDKGSKSQLRYSELTYQKKFNYQFTLTAGLVASGSEVAAQLYGNHTGSNLAAYMQFEKKLFNKLILTGGVRKETFQEDSVDASSPLVFRAGANYELFKATHLRASYGEGYRFPSIAERFINTTVAGIPIKPNPAIQPEKAYSSEIGINQELKIGTWVASADVAAFQTIFNNLIDFTFGFYPPAGVPYTTPPPLTWFGAESRNVENAFIQGLEFSFNSQGKIAGLPVTLTADFTAINPINIDTRDSVNKYEAAHPNLSNSYKDSLKQTEYLNYRSLYTAKVGFEIFLHKFSFGANARYSSFQANIDNSLGTIIPGITDFRLTHDKGQCIVDTHIAYQATKTIRIAYLVKNLFNTLYMDRPGMIDPPRTFMVQATITF